MGEELLGRNTPNSNIVMRLRFKWVDRVAIAEMDVQLTLTEKKAFDQQNGTVL